MPNSIDFYKGVFLHVTPVRVIVPWFFKSCWLISSHIFVFKSLFRKSEEQFYMIKSKTITFKADIYKMIKNLMINEDVKSIYTEPKKFN